MWKTLKACYLVSSIIILSSLIFSSNAYTQATAQAFRQQNGLQDYSPPTWFLEGHFIARERNPVYVFGPVQDFVQAMSGKKTWLIEDLQLKRLEKASADEANSEYSLYLEIVSPERMEYWVFVALPHESAKEWFDARRSYHGRKANNYYGKTQSMLEQAISQGLKIKAELRYFIEKGDVSIDPPEDVIMKKHAIQPVFDLSAGHWLDSATIKK
jgi:hypothetical protein